MLEDSNSAMSKVRKTRNRVPTSCEQCRKRKLKCDRGKPCSNCFKSNTEYMCRYMNGEKVSSSPKINLSNEIIRLKLKINKLETILQLNGIDIADYDDLVGGELSTPEDMTPEEDPVISLIDKFDSMMVKENKILHSGTTSALTFIKADNELHALFEPYHQKYKEKYQEYLADQKLKASEVQNKNSVNFALTSQVTSEICDMNSVDEINRNQISVSIQAGRILEILNMVNKLMPPFYVVNVLIDNFFKNVYPIFPFIEERVFREQVSLVLVPNSDGSCDVSVTHFQNISIVSLLLVVLRFSYVSISIKDSSKDYKEIDNELLAAMVRANIKIDSIFIIHAKSLLMSLPSFESIFKNVTLRNIQVLLYLRLYQTYSPELSDESHEHSLALAIIIQMVRTIGANIDVDQLPILRSDKRECNVWRRIFYKLLSLDLYSSFNYGTPMIIHDSEWTVKLPHLSKEDEEAMHEFKNGNTSNKSVDDIKRIVLENSINNDIKLEFEFYKIGREALEMFQNYQTGSKKSKLVGVVKKLEDFTNKNVPCLYELLNNPSIGRSPMEKLFDIFSIKKFELRIVSVAFTLTFYYLLYLNEKSDFEEADRELCKFDLKATEYSLIIFKFAFDFATFMNQSENSDNNNNNNHNNIKLNEKFKKLFRKSDKFMFNMVSCCFARSLLWIASMFMKNLKERSVTVDQLLKGFSGSYDASVVLNWFNVDVSTPSEDKCNQELLVLIFQYTKDLFFLYNTVKNDFFMAWRLVMMIQLFINYFKRGNTIKCEKYLKSSIMKDEYNGFDIETPQSVSDFMDTTSHQAKSTGTQFSDFNNLFVNQNGNNTDLNMNTDQDLKDLFYDDFDVMIDDIMKSTVSAQQTQQAFTFFSQNDQTNDGQFSGGNFFGEMNNAESQFASPLLNSSSNSNSNSNSNSGSVSGPGSVSGTSYSGSSKRTDRMDSIPESKSSLNSFTPNYQDDISTGLISNNEWGVDDNEIVANYMGGDILSDLGMKPKNEKGYFN
ncbi:hypothetical protein DAMA08_043980 [Martiniozyma asiatica (nom. inval.)]|nr:hypothetical protein DAMA08_043980 [Martiniozyma asiatica]